MSQAQLDKFVALVANDPVVLKDAAQGTEQAEEFIRNVVNYANQHGYDFTEAEAKGWIGEQGKQRVGGELSDSQLEMVAGGKSPQTKKFMNDLVGFLDAHLKPAAPPKPGLGSSIGGVIGGGGMQLGGGGFQLGGALGGINFPNIPSGFNW